jgi:hypothetical protein
MFQNSSGTTPVTAVEQPVGLLLDKSQGLVLGPNLALNSDFATDTVWTKGTGITIGGGVCSFLSAPSGQNVSQGGATIGKYYKVTFTVVSYSAGGFRATRGSVVGSSPGTYTDIILAASVNDFSIRAISTTTGELDNVTFQLLPGNHATQATSASRPVLSARVNLLTKTEQFDDVAWNKLNVTVSAIPVTAPDNTTTADELNEGAATGNHYLSCATSPVSGSTYVASVYAKAGTASFLQVLYDGITGLSDFCNFDLVNGTVGTGTGGQITAVGNGWYRCSVTGTSDATGNGLFFCVASSASAPRLGGSFTGTSKTLYIWGADLRVTNDGVNLPVYQRVNTSTDYDATGFPYYLSFDGSDDSMATNTITPGIDKAQVFAGVRKLSDAAQGVVAEMSATIASNNGTFLLAAPDDASATFAFDSKGTTQVDAIASSLTAPLTRVVTGIGDISGDTAIIRINGVQADQETSDQGTGNYLAYPLYIGRRNNATLPLSGRIYSLITRFGANLDVVTINNTEVYVSGKMGGGYVSPIRGYDFLVDANGHQITDASDNPLFTQVIYT